MTTHASSPTRPTTDPRPAFFAAVATACDVIAAASPAQLDGPTPCTEFDVRALLGHLLAVSRRVTSVAAGVPAVGSAPLATDVADDGWAEAASADVRDLEAAWTDPAVLGREMVLPFGTLP